MLCDHISDNNSLIAKFIRHWDANQSTTNSHDPEGGAARLCHYRSFLNGSTRACEMVLFLSLVF